MKYIDVVPNIQHDQFVVRFIMADTANAADNYNLSQPLIFQVKVRRTDGLYRTEMLKYPDENIDYDGNVRLFFFEMYVTHIAQIVGLKVNGKDIYTAEYQKIPDIQDDIYIRYDDTIMRYTDENDFSKINLFFQVEPTHEPKTLRVVDESDWGILGRRKSIIEIITPGASEPVTHFLAKNQVNIFNSKSLEINCDAKDFNFIDLPDGIYDITIKGSPSSYFYSRKYLKTDLIQLKLDKLYVKVAWLCPGQPDSELIKKIEEIEYLIKAANSNMRVGNSCLAHELLIKAQNDVDEINNCIKCDC